MIDEGVKQMKTKKTKIKHNILNKVLNVILEFYKYMTYILNIK